MRFIPANLVFAALVSANMAAGAALAKTCDLAIEGNDAMQFNKKELSVSKDCTEVKLTLKHTGKLPKASMGHNWTLAEDKDMQGVVSAAITAGLANDYMPKDDKRILAHTKLVGGGESDSVTFKTAGMKPGTAYKFFCTFPGHSGIMNGVFSIK